MRTLGLKAARRPTVKSSMKTDRPMAKYGRSSSRDRKKTVPKGDETGLRDACEKTKAKREGHRYSNASKKVIPGTGTPTSFSDKKTKKTDSGEEPRDSEKEGGASSTENSQLPPSISFPAIYLEKSSAAGPDPGPGKGKAIHLHLELVSGPRRLTRPRPEGTGNTCLFGKRPLIQGSKGTGLCRTEVEMSSDRENASKKVGYSATRVNPRKRRGMSQTIDRVEKRKLSIDL